MGKKLRRPRWRADDRCKSLARLGWRDGRPVIRDAFEVVFVDYIQVQVEAESALLRIFQIPAERVG